MKMLSFIFIILFYLTICTGCAHRSSLLAIPVKGELGHIHYIIIGFGIITCPLPNENSAVHVSKSHVLGAKITNHPGLKMGIGYTSESLVLIPDGAEDVRLEISQNPGGPVKIETQKVNINPSN